MPRIYARKDNPNPRLNPQEALPLIPRLGNWEEKWVEYIHGMMEASKEKALYFSWDQDDPYGENCISFTFNGIAAITGYDIYTKYAGGLRYSTPLGALLVLRKIGVGSLPEMLGCFFEEIPLIRATTGDALLVPSAAAEWGSGCALADPPFFYCVGQEGLYKGLMTEATAAYKVGI